MTVKKVNKRVGKKEAINELWNRGNLSYKLKGTQVKVYDAFKQANDDINVICCSRRYGKCRSESAETLTPQGVKTFKDLKVGDVIYAYEDGKVFEKTIDQIHEQGIKEVVDLVNGGRILETCTLDHRFLVYNTYTKEKTVKAVKDFNSRDKIVREFIKIPCGNIHNEYAYVLGVTLGDGCSRERNNGLVISGADEEVISKCASILGTKYYEQHPSNFSWILSKEGKVGRGKVCEKITFPYYEEWCKGRYAHEKIIDLNVVKTWNRESQLALLAGLLDSDGTVCASDNILQIQFNSQSKSMTNAFKELFYNLFQYDPYIYTDNRDKYKNGPCYKIGIKNNLINKKALLELDKYLQVPRKKWKKDYANLLENNSNEYYVGVKVVNKRKEMTYDIGIDTKSHLYLTGNGLVTHNSFILCLLAVEQCITLPDAVVKYACPTQKQVKEIVRKIMRPILQDCPPHLMPEWKEAEKLYLFPNGAEIQMAGTDNGNIENIRGGHAHLCIVDEAGFATELDYAVDNVLAPTTDTTNGKVILASTPNYKDPHHIFNVEYVLPRQNAGTLVKFTIHDAPMISEDRKRKIIERYGEDNPRYRCEYLCEVAIDPEKLVVGEFTPEKEQELVKEVEMPSYCDLYVSMDIGYKDLTGVLFAYFDYMKSTVVILDELIINGSSLTSDYLAEQIHIKEHELFRNPKSGMPVDPTLRIADNNNPILLNDLFRLHNLSFIATAKDNKEAQINELKLRIKQNRIIIHPRCKTLLYHLKAARWNKKRNDFERLKDIKETGVRGGHADLLDALIYLVRNVMVTKNPFPDGYFEMSGSNVFNPGKPSINQQALDFMRKILNIKGK